MGGNTAVVDEGCVLSEASENKIKRCTEGEEMVESQSYITIVDLLEVYRSDGINI